MSKKVLITTGGTGGHIFPAMAVAKQLIDNEIEVLMVGDDKLGKFVNNTDVKYKIISTAKKKSIKSIYLIIKGIFESIFILKKEKPNLIVGFGSYASFPILVVGKLLKVPIALHEQNIYAGRVNRWFQSCAKVIFTSFPEIFGFNISNSNKLKYLGNPIRENIKKLDNREYKYPNIKNGDKFKILIVAGSGGASFFGNEFIRFLDYVDDNFKKNVHIIHQVREEDVSKIRDTYRSKYISCEVKTFFEDMDVKYKETHLIICRSGATTIAELSIVGLPTIFFPSPFVANDHQYKNADMLKKQEACLVFKQTEFEPSTFGKFISNLIFDEEQLSNLSNNIRKFGINNADITITQTIKELL